MKIKLNLLVIILIFIFGTSLAQFSNPQNEKKINPNLLQELKSLYQEAAKGIIINKALIKKNHYIFIKVDDEGKLLLQVSFNNVSFTNQLEQLGCKIKTVGIKELYVWIPMDKLEKVAELDWIKEISCIPLFSP